MSDQNQFLLYTAPVDSIRQVHEHCVAIVNRTVNTTLTARNWTIGAYIREYEQRGADRAKYGEALIERLAERPLGAGKVPPRAASGDYAATENKRTII